MQNYTLRIRAQDSLTLQTCLIITIFFFSFWHQRDVQSSALSKKNPGWNRNAAARTTKYRSIYRWRSRDALSKRSICIDITQVFINVRSSRLISGPFNWRNKCRANYFLSQSIAGESMPGQVEHRTVSPLIKYFRDVCRGVSDTRSNYVISPAFFQLFSHYLTIC